MYSPKLSVNYLYFSKVCHRKHIAASFVKNHPALTVLCKNHNIQHNEKILNNNQCQIKKVIFSVKFKWPALPYVNAHKNIPPRNSFHISWWQRNLQHF